MSLSSLPLAGEGVEVRPKKKFGVPSQGIISTIDVFGAIKFLCPQQMCVHVHIKLSALYKELLNLATFQPTAIKVSVSFSNNKKIISTSVQ